MADRKRSLEYLDERVSQRLRDITLSLGFLFQLNQVLSEQVAHGIRRLELKRQGAIKRDEFDDGAAVCSTCVQRTSKQNYFLNS